MVEPDLCKAIKGERETNNCVVDKTHGLFKHCTVVGGTVKGDKCIIPEDKLKDLV